MRENEVNLNKKPAFKEQRNNGRKYGLSFEEKLGKKYVCIYVRGVCCMKNDRRRQQKTKNSPT